MHVWNDCNVGEEIVVDAKAVIESTDNFTYTADRALNAAKPAFADGSALTASNITTTGMTITAPIAHIDDKISNDAVPYYYIVAIDEEDGEIIYSKRYASWYWQGDAQPDTINLAISGLTAGKTYEVMVVAESFFAKTSNALTLQVTTATE